MSDADLLRGTVLSGLHREAGAKMVPFAGYSMPVQYPLGVLKEHLHTRASAGIFDVSHMGQIVVRGERAGAALESLIPSNILGLAVGRQRYGLLTNDAGGIEDDMMIANRGDHFLLVVNAARKDEDLARLQVGLTPFGVTAEMIDTRALLAVQGPLAEVVLAAHLPGVSAMRFMDAITLDWRGHALWITRSGYSGEDGFEISVPDEFAETFVRMLLADDRLALIGLGARDSLRLEAGLCLYGQDIDDTTTPGAAGLSWAVSPVRRAGGARAGAFPGADRILAELDAGAPVTRAGLRPEGRAPMRAGVEIFADETSETAIGRITSGGFGPTLGAPMAMARIPTAYAAPGTRLWGAVRNKRQPVEVCALPFVTPGYKR